jgi:hypothetical protein
MTRYSIRIMPITKYSVALPRDEQAIRMLLENLRGRCNLLASWNGLNSVRASRQRRAELYTIEINPSRHGESATMAA